MNSKLNSTDCKSTPTDNITMKRIIYVFITATLMSCSTTRNMQYIAIFENEGVGAIPSSYIILKGGALKQYDFFWYSYGTIGNYVIEKDTLYVFPKYKYYSDSIHYLDTLNIKPQKFLMEKDRLIDVTDYTIETNDPTDLYINDLLKNLPNNVYKRR